MSFILAWLVHFIDILPKNLFSQLDLIYLIVMLRSRSAACFPFNQFNLISTQISKQAEVSEI